MTTELEQRVTRVEFAVSAIPEIRDAVKSIEHSAKETAQVLAKMEERDQFYHDRLNTQGKALDDLVPEVTRLRSGFDSHDWQLLLSLSGRQH
jgi:hypothetical protein